MTPNDKPAGRETEFRERCRRKLRVALKTVWLQLSNLGTGKEFDEVLTRMDAIANRED
jgi:hypothetical protein